ncbi:MAG TPA: argininosuccinate lyase [Candidatus Dormibacteraeota bacterium]|nr:argininosuccinate lyase [Candidatus Dormibacteraeota bacterium]
MAPEPRAAKAASPERAPRLWGGRFAGGPARAVQEFTDSLPVDRRLYRQDIAGSVAHARMLGVAGIIPVADAQALVRGLAQVRKEMDSGAFVFVETDEDVHTAVERRLHELLGPEVGGRLHTGRSRNDQVALDLRLYAKGAITDIGGAVTRLQAALLKLAHQHQADVMPAYTHLQRAQPTTLGHHLLAYVAMLQRDFDRLQDAHDRTDIMPLGSGAATGSSLPLRRDLVAQELDFTSISQNSLDAVSDRDFAVELMAACALVMVHLSRLAEEVVLWSTSEFGFLELSDDYATGSSLMPQKKNPDVPELVRGRAGRVFGHLTAMLTTLKGLPLAYNRDLQEDKEALFGSVDTTGACLDITARMLARATFRTDAMAAAGGDPALLATEVAEYLVRRGVPFREAHDVVGRAVRRAQQRRVPLSELTLEQWQSLHDAFDAEVLELFDPARALARREAAGSPGPRPLRRALARAAVAIKRNQEWLKANRTAP